jgi:hypothetical protein
MVVYLTDHGHLFHEHDLQGKPTGPLGNLYEVTTRVPLMIRHPDGLGAGARVPGIAQHPDILPTILEFLGVPIPSTVHGHSLLPMMADPTRRLRTHAFSGRFSRSAGRALAHARQEAASAFDGWAGLERFGEPFTVTNEEWALVVPPGRPRELYDLRADPRQERTVAAEQPRVAAELHGQLIGWLDGLGAAPERVRAYRDETSAAAGLPAETELFAIRDGEGQTYAFLDEPHAAEALRPDLPAQAIERTTFGAIRERDRRALVYVHEQYYYPEDLT